MTEQFDLIVRNGAVVTAVVDRSVDIGIRDGRFAALSERGTLDGESADEIDATGLQLLPGVIDGHVHFREPGFEYKEDWLTGSRAAVMGGVTTVLDMPNTQPPTRGADDARQKANLADQHSYCDFGLFGVVDADFHAGRQAELVGSGLVVGLKVFLGPTTGGLAAPNDADLLTALSLARDAGMRVGFHAEDAEIIARIASMVGDSTDALAHLETRPAAAEVAAIDHAGRLLEQTGAAGHVFHLSSAAGLAAVERLRGRGLDLTCEVTAHHCFLGRDDYGRLGGQVKVNPPVRGEPDASALLEALADGRIDCIASDHAPHAPGEKSRDYPTDALAGFAGVETSLPLFLTAVAQGQLSLERLSDATSAAPARVWGLAGKGSIEVGADADLTIVDVTREGMIRGADLHGKHPLTPFEGVPTVGAAVATVVRGRIVMRDGELLVEPGWGQKVSRRPLLQRSYGMKPGYGGAKSR
jgi:dihydroorotase